MLKINITLNEAHTAMKNYALGKIRVERKDIIGEINGYQIIHCNDVIWGTNSRIACAGSFAYTDCIYVDDFYFMFPDYVQEFILYHELGHIVNKHTDSVLDIRIHNLRRLFRVDELEIEADAYAVKYLGKEKSLKALMYLHNRIHLPMLSRREIKKRIRRVEA